MSCATAALQHESLLSCSCNSYDLSVSAEREGAVNECAYTVRTCVERCLLACLRACMRACARTCVCACMCVCVVCVCVCVQVCVCACEFRV